jgi:uncharacterized protein (TIGR00369 family)
MSNADTAAPHMARVAEVFIRGVPHNAALGMELVGFSVGRAVIELPYNPDLVGNPETGVIHGGAITALIDSTCGGAVLSKLDQPRRVATLDLRIDYLKPATPGLAVRCAAECFKVTRHVAFVRATAYHESAPDDAVATAAGTFVIFRPEAAAQGSRPEEGSS